VAVADQDIHLVKVTLKVADQGEAVIRIPHTKVLAQ
jgi:hypothetical protein